MLMTLEDRFDKFKLRFLAGILIVTLIFNTTMFSGISTRVPDKGLFGDRFKSDKSALGVNSNIGMLAMLGMAAASAADQLRGGSVG